jgi:hypothetical protein
MMNNKGRSMTREDAIATLKKAQINADIEAAHSAADGVLCELLRSLGYDDVVSEWLKVEKWYA